MHAPRVFAFTVRDFHFHLLPEFSGLFLYSCSALIALGTYLGSPAANAVLTGDLCGFVADRTAGCWWQVYAGWSERGKLRKPTIREGTCDELES